MYQNFALERKILLKTLPCPTFVIVIDGQPIVSREIIEESKPVRVVLGDLASVILLNITHSLRIHLSSRSTLVWASQFDWLEKRSYPKFLEITHIWIPDCFKLKSIVSWDLNNLSINVRQRGIERRNVYVCYNKNVNLDSTKVIYLTSKQVSRIQSYFQ